MPSSSFSNSAFSVDPENGTTEKEDAAGRMFANYIFYY
jgi:hypothetical protein